MSKITNIKPLVGAVETRTVKAIPKQADAHYATAEHRAWRKQVMQRAGWRCEHVDSHGRRCARRAPQDRLHADHIVELKDGGAPLDPANGQALCTPHNTAKGIQARRARHH